MEYGRKNDTLKDKVTNITAAFVCGAVGGNMLIYSVGQIFVKGNPLLTWTGFGMGIVFFVFAIFFVGECSRESP